MIAEFGKPGATFSMKQQSVEGDYAYILWTAETAENVYQVGTDTFVVRDGKIVAQSFAARITPKAENTPSFRRGHPTSRSLSHKTSTARREAKGVRKGEMNKRKLGSFALFACSLLFAHPPEAQQADETPPDRIPNCYLPFRCRDPHRGIPPGSARAWVRGGKNIVIEWRSAEGYSDRQSALAAELVRLKVDVIVSVVRHQPALLRKQQRQFPSSWRRTAILLVMGSLPAWRDLGETLLDCLPSARS